jgi:hypothetical protein
MQELERLRFKVNVVRKTRCVRLRSYDVRGAAILPAGIPCWHRQKAAGKMPAPGEMSQ